jgi:two-component system, NarL family, invasion response regulator UvrY
VIRVVIADDHELIRDGLSKLIEKQKNIRLVGKASTAQEAMTLLRGGQVDVLVLDIGLPDKDGIEVLKDIKAERIKTRVLMLSMYSENRYAYRALKNGAAGYLTKDHAATTISTAIEEIYEKGSYITKEAARELYEGLGDSGENAKHERLSDREYQVFLLLGQGKTTGGIAENLNLSISTINTYRARILEKMGFSTNAEIIKYLVINELD